jgi:hypothetical protein
MEAVYLKLQKVAIPHAYMKELNINYLAVFLCTRPSLRTQQLAVVY